MLNLTKNTKIMRATLALTMATGLMLTTNPANAEPGYYVGGAYGLSRVNDSDFDENNNSVLKIFVGGKYNDYIGVEGAVNDYGTSGQNGYSSDLTGNTIALVGFYPLADRFEVFIKGGRLWWRDKVVVFNTLSDTLTGNDNFYGVGVNFNLSEIIALRAEMERYKVGDEIGFNADASAHVDVASLGVSMNF